MLQQERMVQMGDWLKVNGEAIYGTKRWRVTSDGPMVESVNPKLDKRWVWTETRQRPMVFYTSKGEDVYAICLAWPEGELKLDIPVTTTQTQVQLLGHPGFLRLNSPGKGLTIQVPQLPPSKIPCRNAWVFKLSGLKN